MDLLLGRRHKDPPRLAKLIAGSYFTPLADTVRAEFANEPARSGEDIFQSAFAVASRDKFAVGRMTSFVTMYGFSRNFAFTSGMTAVAILTKAGLADGDCTALDRFPCWTLAVAAAALSTIMFARYLKYRRSHVKEVLMSYVAAKGQEARRPEQHVDD
ncbi:hypothetical protein [Thalassobaculum sp.]|uniref:hypothetical protein n=1 Tax=Thalassobaculum sp. TaxID=2022740 RepID=UPI0032F083FC